MSLVAIYNPPCPQLKLRPTVSTSSPPPRSPNLQHIFTHTRAQETGLLKTTKISNGGSSKWVCVCVQLAFFLHFSTPPKIEMGSVIRCSWIQLKRIKRRRRSETRNDCPKERGGGGLEEAGGAEGLLGGIHHVEEAIFIPLLFVDLRDGGRHRHHAVTVDQEEEGLVGVELEAPPGGQTEDDKSERSQRRSAWEQKKSGYLMILMSSLMFTWSGTRNLVLSSMGSCFSPLYRSMITCRGKTKSG